ncbi:MAG: hypothetical protein BIP78_0446 [Candidatus Bipolaricaulis sibiricus]|uniref:Uncharacterized protein n=1 Tax=Bipolaricaulis sibiricus TaxID=2501609 RepID=A0A410FT97_BIPS1|nr:MAG: hypothetical protein BIP78_0446 [Candidatus Bipolaricaulis sibiricus]
MESLGRLSALNVTKPTPAEPSGHHDGPGMLATLETWMTERRRSFR